MWAVGQLVVVLFSGQLNIHLLHCVSGMGYGVCDGGTVAGLFDLNHLI